MDSIMTGRPVSVYCDGVGCHALRLRHGILVWQHIGQSTTTSSRHRRDMTSDVKTTLNPTNNLTKNVSIDPKMLYYTLSFTFNTRGHIHTNPGCSITVPVSK